MKNENVRNMVKAAMLAALCTVGTMIIKIDMPVTGGYINLGDFFVILSGWILGPVWGFAAAGCGSMLADVFLSYMNFAPATFLIKGLMAVAAYYSFLLLRRTLKNISLSALFSAAISECIMVTGYFIFEFSILGFGLAAASSIPGNAVQGFAAIVFGVIAMTVFRKNTFLRKLLKVDL